MIRNKILLLFFFFNSFIFISQENKSEWQEIFSVEINKNYSKELMLIICNVLQEQYIPHLDVMNKLLNTFTLTQIINLVDTAKQFLLITNNTQTIQQMEGQVQQLNKLLLNNDTINKYLLEKNITTDFLKNTLQNMLLLQSFILSNKINEAFFVTNHPKINNEFNNEKIFIHKKLYYIFYFKNTPQNIKNIPQIFKNKKKGIFSINKLSQKEINRAISLGKKHCNFFIRSENKNGFPHKLKEGEFAIDNWQNNNKNKDKYQVIILCDKEIQKKINGMQVLFLFMEIQTPLSIQEEDIYNMFKILNNISTTKIQITLEEIINNNRELKVLNYSQIQNASIENFFNTPLMEAVIKFPKCKFKIIQKEGKDNKTNSYNIFIIFDVENISEPRNNSVKSLRKIHNYIKNNLGAYISNLI